MSRQSPKRSAQAKHKDGVHALITRGRAAAKLGQFDAAMRAYDLALQQAPGNSLLLTNAAHASWHLGRMHDVVRYAGQVRETDAEAAIAFELKAKALHVLKLHQASVLFLQSWPAALRDSHAHWYHLGLAQTGLGRTGEAIQALLQALNHKIDDALTYYYLGSAFYEAELKQEAAECFRTAVVLGVSPHEIQVHGLLAFTERENCRWDLFGEHWQAVQDHLAATEASAKRITTPFGHLSLSDDPQHHLKVSTLLANCLRDVAVVHATTARPAGARIRLGYLSGDFHQHATCVLMAHVFEQHDRARFEVFAYSTGPDDGSAMRQRVQRAFEHFVDVRGLSDEQVAQLMVDDHLDILIDLKGFTAHHRLGIMARRPAPVQATFLGFPGSTGSAFMDYIIGDPVVTPIDHATDFSEHIAQLPVCYQPNDRQRPRPAPLTRVEAGLPEQGLVLCGFNQAYKISPEVLDVWCRLMQELPDAVLWLLEWHGQARPNLIREIEARGIDPKRVIWAPKADIGVHISRLALADIFLDTWPYNAHTTCSDALWAGVPVVTYEGRTFACRVASSLLQACGLPELITRNLNDYQQKVLQLAADPAERARLRTHLAAQRDSSPLFDSLRFTRDFEALILRMVERQRQGLPCAPLLPPHGEVVAAQPATVCAEVAPAARAEAPGMKVAVVTPYHAESRTWLERCIRSVQQQTYGATHFLVSDGIPQDWIDEVPGIRHVRLGVAHRDYGNTPRAIGGLLAANEGFDAVCFLDADNWYAPEHVEQCVRVAQQTRADYVVAQRRLVRDDMSVLPFEYEEDTDGSHVDTNCFCLLKGAFHTIHRWVLAPKPMASLFDRFYLKSLQKDGLSVAFTNAHTVMYLCTWAEVYRKLGETVPEFAKPNIAASPVVQWASTMAPDEVKYTRNLMGNLFSSKSA